VSGTDYQEIRLVEVQPGLVDNPVVCILGGVTDAELVAGQQPPTAESVADARRIWSSSGRKSLIPPPASDVARGVVTTTLQFDSTIHSFVPLQRATRR